MYLLISTYKSLSVKVFLDGGQNSKIYKCKTFKITLKYANVKKKIWIISVMNFEIQNNSLETDETYIHKHLTKMKLLRYFLIWTHVNICTFNNPQIKQNL